MIEHSAGRVRLMSSQPVNQEQLFLNPDRERPARPELGL
jgi:hypothetical protein